MTTANEQLEQMTKAYQADHPGTDYYSAYSVVADGHPALVAKALAEPYVPSIEAPVQKIEPNAAEVELDKLAKAAGGNYYDAYAKVAEENPQLYERAVNGGYTHEQYGIAKMLEARTAELSMAEQEGPAGDQGVVDRLRREVRELRQALGARVFNTEPGITDALKKELDYWRSAVPAEHPMMLALEAAVKDDTLKPAALAEYIKYWCEGREGDQEFCKAVQTSGEPEVERDVLFAWLSV